MKTIEILNACFETVKNHLESRKGSVGKRISPRDLKEKMDLSLRETGLSHEDLLGDMKKYLELTPNTSTPHFQNQLFSGLNPYALAGEWIATITNTTMATYEVAPVATLIERELVTHLIQKAGWVSGEGIMVTGGSNANFSAMLVARNTLYPTTKTEGIGNRKFVAFISEEAHYSFDKAVNMLGMGLQSLKKVPSDESGKMNPSLLREMIEKAIEAGETPYFIGATAGTTVLGAYDPLEEIALIAREYKLWFHVDGAWGGSVLLSSKHKHLMKGIESADSLTLDTHKMLGSGLISSFFLTKHANVLRKSNDSGGGDYIFHESDASSFDTGPSSLQCGRRVDAFKVWLMWRSLGDKGLELMIDQFFENAVKAKTIIESKSELQLLHDPEMLNLCFSFRDGMEDIKVAREKLLSQGSFYVNVSTRKGKTFFRMILVNPDLNEALIEKTINEIIEAGKRT